MTTQRNLLAKRLITSGVATSITLALTVPVMAQPQQCDVVFAVNDANLNNSQIVFMNGDGTGVTPLGPEYPAHDMEAMDIDKNNVLYTASGDDTANQGFLYKVNKSTGDLLPIGPLCVREADGISFNLIDNTLWGWGQDQGLFHVLRGSDGELDLSTCTIVLPGQDEIEDLTWDNAGKIIYAVGNVFEGDHDAQNDSKKTRVVLAFDVTAGTISQICRDELAPISSEIEGIETQPDDTLMLSYHNENRLSVLAILNPVNCEFTPPGGDPGKDVVNPTRFNDIEALACCIDQGGTLPWTYQADFVGDATGLSILEIYGMAVKIENGIMTVAINSNMGPGATQDLTYGGAADGHVSFSDMVFDFSGKKYAAKFAEKSNSGVTARGLYEVTALKDVTAENYGWDSFKAYSPFSKGGNLGALPLQNNYFSWEASRSVPMSIKTGTRVADDTFTMLDAAQLQATGLNFAGNGISGGSKTFGFSFKMSAGMKGDFIAYFFTECINDGMVIKVHQVSASCSGEVCPVTTDTPSVTVSMPTPTNSNPTATSAYTIALIDHTGNSWTYQVDRVTGKNLSHWDLALGNCLNHVTSYTTTGSDMLATGDPSEANPAPGAVTAVKTSPLIKWDTRGGMFTITLDGNYPATNIPVLAKTAKVYNTGLVTGPDCTTLCK